MICSQQRVVLTKHHPSPTSNAEIMQPYYFVSWVTSEKKGREDEIQDAACRCERLHGTLATLPTGNDTKAKEIVSSKPVCVLGNLGCFAV